MPSGVKAREGYSNRSMEFFHEPKIDWMGIKWYFIALSLALAAAGLISMAVKKGLAYGIDFRGGTVVDVQVCQGAESGCDPQELDRQNLRGATIQRIGPPSDHEVMIGLDLKTTTSSEALDEGKRAIVDRFGGLVRPGPAG